MTTEEINNKIKQLESEKQAIIKQNIPIITKELEKHNFKLNDVFNDVYSFEKTIDVSHLEWIGTDTVSEHIAYDANNNIINYFIVDEYGSMFLDKKLNNISEYLICLEKLKIKFYKYVLSIATPNVFWSIDYPGVEDNLCDDAEIKCTKTKIVNYLTGEMLLDGRVL